MAIRDIVLDGYGNGTYSPGVNKLPTDGYSIGAAAVGVASRYPIIYGPQAKNHILRGVAEYSHIIHGPQEADYRLRGK